MLEELDTVPVSKAIVNNDDVNTFLTTMKSPKEEKLEVINKARSIIRGERTLDRNGLKDLIKKLEQYDQFSYATEVLLLRFKLDEKNASPVTTNDYETLARYIYKDHSLPSSIKFDKALQQLSSHVGLATTTRCEALGLAGAIYKRVWQFDHLFRNLTLSRYYYKRGFDKWKEFIKTYNDTSIENDGNDDGYNAINYAYINELMAVEKLEEHGKITGVTEGIITLFDHAKETRNFILAQFIQLTEKGEHQLKRDNYKPWVIATIAEAYFGLGNYEQAARFIMHYLGLAEVKAWEKRSFSQQLFSLAYLQDYSHKFLSKHLKPGSFLYGDFESVIQKIRIKDINNCLNFVKDDAQTTEAAQKGIEIKKEGKLGLGLSGGGFRAALFHIGVLASLAEKDELRNVEIISCVSGGSIIGAYYYLKLKKLLETKADADIDKDDYIKIVKEIERDFLPGIQNNLRMRIFSHLGSNFKMLKDNYSRTHRLGELYEKYLFKDLIEIKRSADETRQGRKDDEIYMSDLFITPKDAPTFFVPTIDNWKRKNKIPQLVLNATSVNTGHNWQFTASWMGEPPGNIQPDIDVKPRLRRMYYEEAPDQYKNFRLGYAVGASSCVPVMFHPMPLPDLYPGIELQLVDGGVHDNQGIGALLEQECKNMIVSDGSGQMATDKAASQNEGSLFFRSDLILQERLRELQFLDIKQRNNTTQINRLFTVHLKSDLANRPVSWKYCTDPPRTIMYSNETDVDNGLTKYGILRKVQLYLSQIRTDLDSFNDVESYALMYSGYAQMNYEYNTKQQEDKRDNKDHNQQQAISPQWNFFKIKDYLTRPEKAAQKEKVFKEASRGPFKVYYLSKTVKIAVIVLAVLVGATILAFCNPLNPDTWNYSFVNITVKLVVTALILFLLGLIFKVVATLMKARSFIRQKAAFIVVIIVAWVVCNIYLALLNNVYNKYGKLKAVEPKV